MENSNEKTEEEEILFVEDRRPGNVCAPVIHFNQQKIERKVVTQDFILLSNDEDSDNKAKCDEADSGGKPERTSNDESGPHDHQQLDTELYVMEDRNPRLTGQDTQSPKYKINQNFLKLHEPKAAKRNKFANACWNCGETTHALRDCKEPRNHVQIARSRKEFQESKSNMPVYTRYHLGKTQNFAHLVPGELSEDLRLALGLDSRQLPLHIYRMRRLGYPPGWLQEAVVSHSGISMFDGDGKEVADPGVEIGEVMEQGGLDKIDARKIIAFPGFNVPPPPDTFDDSEYYRCPPFSKQQSLEVMLERLEGRMVGGYKRKKLSLNSTISQLDDSSQSAESVDMEYEETPEKTELPEDNCKFVPPLPEEELPPPPPTELPDEPSEVSADSSSMLNSSVENTSLIELEEQKRLLLAQLNDVTPLCSTPESRVGKIKSVDLGTPILKSVSPYARLPSAEKFSVDICDVINFENLPDSTGKYEKMSGLIRKVRSTLSKINAEL